jgi:hypothetical protein
MAACLATSHNLNRWAITFTLVILAFGVSIMRAQEPAPGPDSEQTFFTESEGFDRAVSLPPKVLQALLRQKEIKDALVDADKEQRDNPSKLFEAATVHLRAPDEVDFIVRGNQPASGGDNAWFWVVILAAGESPRVVRWCTASSLEVIDTRTNGYKNISCEWSSPSENIHWEYHFNGQKYILWKKTDSSKP